MGSNTILATNLRAVVSIGTNSTRLLIVRDREPVLHRSIGTRLGAKLKESGPLDPEGVERTLKVIDDYAREIRERGARAAAIATSAMRRASNGDAFAREVEQRLGTPLEILSGEREAELSFRGATANRKHKGIVGVLDVGGGSAEYAFGHEHVEGNVSCEIGAVRLSEAIPALLGKTVPANVESLEAEARSHARERLSRQQRNLRRLAAGGLVEPVEHSLLQHVLTGAAEAGRDDLPAGEGGLRQDRIRDGCNGCGEQRPARRSELCHHYGSAHVVH